MDIPGDEFVEKFMETHPEFLIELKWAAFMAYLNDSDAWNGRDDLKKDTVAFCDVFRKHKVDPEVLIEAMTVIVDSQKEKTKSDDISSQELTNFVATLMKIQKMGEDDAAEE